MNNDFEKQLDPHLEPRVAKLEVGLDRLMEDVRSLASIVRDQGANVEKQLNGLTIAVTQAAGPRKTDWSNIIAGIMLIMAIGSAAFWPLNQSQHNNRNAIEAVSQHNKEEVLRLEKIIENVATGNQRNLDIQDKKLQRETELITTEIKNKVDTISGKYDREISDLGNRLLTRINGYEQIVRDRDVADLEELRHWRLKAMTGELKTKKFSDDYSIITKQTPNMSIPGSKP